MAIVRSVRRFHSRFISSSSSRQAATEISNLVSGSNIEQPGRSSAAPFTSERPIRRRVSTADRKAMLESFVNKYRDMNMGKFPSVSCAQKEVGGGYYIIRKILQEIEYDFRTSSVEKGLIKDLKKQTEGENTTGMEISTESSGSQEVSNSQITVVQQLCEDPWAVNNFDNYELKEVLQPSTSSANVGKSNIRRIEQIPEDKLIDESPMEEKFVSGDLQSTVKLHHDGIRNINRDMPEQQKDGELREKPSLWGNLKSLATDFINMWKK